MKTKIHFKFNGKKKFFTYAHSLPMTRDLMSICIMKIYVRAQYKGSNREKAEALIEKNEKAEFICKRMLPFHKPHPKHKSIIAEAYFRTL